MNHWIVAVFSITHGSRLNKCNNDAWPWVYESFFKRRAKTIQIHWRPTHLSLSSYLYSKDYMSYQSLNMTHTEWLYTLIHRWLFMRVNDFFLRKNMESGNPQHGILFKNYSDSISQWIWEKCLFFLQRFLSLRTWRRWEIKKQLFCRCLISSLLYRA